MENKKYDYNLFIPPEEIEQMTDKEYYKYLTINLIKSEEDLEYYRYLDFENFEK